MAGMWPHEAIDARAARVLMEIHGARRLTVHEIIRATARVFDVQRTDIIRQSVFPEHLVPRQLAMAIACAKLAGTPRGARAHIGREFCRDRTCVRRAVLRYGGLVERVIRERELPLPSDLELTA